MFNKIWADRVSRNYLYAFVKDLSFFGAVLVPFFTDWGGLTLFQVQLVQSWFSIWVFLLEVPTGAVADRIGRKHSIALGSLIVGFAVLLYGSFPHFAVFLVAEFLFAVGYALTSGADQALLYDTLVEEGREDESKKILGRANSFHLAGMMTAAPIGSLIAARFGLNAPMLMSSIPFFLASLIGWSIPEPRVKSKESESTRYLTIVKRGFTALAKHRVIRTLAIDSVLVAAAAYFIVWFYQPLLSKLSFPLAYFGLVQAILLGSQLMVSDNFSRLEKFLGSGKRYLTNTALIVALTLFAASLLPNLWTVALMVVVGGGLGYTRATYIANLAHKHIESRERATILSSLGMLRRFALIVLNPAVGYLATLSLSVAIFVVGLLPLTTLLIREETY
jgi:MFS family permease